MKKYIYAVAIVMMSSLGAQAQSRDIITYDMAAKGVAACAKLAAEKGWSMSVIVVDRAGHEVSTARMTDALKPSYIGAGLKAQSALSWSMPTADIEKFIADKPQFRAFPGLLTIGGGLPIMSKSGSLIGAIGVAGSAPNHDVACAQAGLDAMGAK